jgi:hypothetical protein
MTFQLDSDLEVEFECGIIPWITHYKMLKVQNRTQMSIIGNAYTGYLIFFQIIVPRGSASKWTWSTIHISPAIQHVIIETNLKA